HILCILTERTLQRLHDRITTYDCNGRLIGFVDVKQHWIHCTLRHEDNLHPLEISTRRPVDDEVRRFIHNFAIGRSPTYVHDEANIRFPAAMLTYAQVYYWYKQSLERYYRCEDNALHSAQRLLQMHEVNNFGQVNRGRGKE
ncbi:hypothetical protein DM01DRAFT_1076264, partial [Hesseltinella vesiculosa]